MTSIRTANPGRLELTFAITDDALLHALTESSGTCPASPPKGGRVRLPIGRA
jgi:hypothetical protein